MFTGFFETPLDAALLIVAANSGSKLMVPVKQRLGQREREGIQSGSVFVFTEKDTGMKRWTDGKRWSKSRVEGQFLVYRSLGSDVCKGVKRDEPFLMKGKSDPIDDSVLLKKTFAISIDGNVTHVVSFIDQGWLLY
jgi:hypothetical protein